MSRVQNTSKSQRVVKDEDKQGRHCRLASDSNSDSVLGSSSTITTRVVHELKEIASIDWDRCLGESGSPFLRYHFLEGLERCGCVGPDTGWTPRYVIAEREGQVVGVTPAYIKTHSQGEFIFDWSWADAAHRAGMPYYPKLVVTSPFSPVGSEKLLVSDSFSGGDRTAVKSALIAQLRTVTQEEHLTGLHLLFVSCTEADILESQSLLRRHTLQFQWNNEGYSTFDDFLSYFRSKRRNQIKRERRRLRESGVEVRVYQGNEVCEEHIPMIYKFYRATVEKYFYGNLYLNYAFFEYLFQTQRENLCLLLAHYGERVIGGSFNLISNGVLYGRYWGVEPDLEVDYLHFEVCAYKGIEVCIERGWSRFEAGSGGGAHKYGRGFLPQVIYSAHEVYLPGFKPALTELLTDERQMLDRQLLELEGEVLKVDKR